jgi:hypothetical protein
MKRIILAVIIGFAAFTFQSCADSKTEKDDVISTSDVPASVQSAFSAKYSTASDIKWEDAHEDTTQTFKAKFTMNGKKMKAEFDRNGGLVKEEEDN